MKKIIVLALLLSHFQSRAQSNAELQKAMKDYSFSVYQNFRWGSDAFKYLMISSMQKQGYSGQLEIMKGMETIDKNIEFRKATYRAWSRIASNVDILGANLLAINMPATSAEIMANYIIKFNNNEENAQEKRKQTTDYDIAKLQYQKLIGDYKEGKLVESKNLDLSNLIKNVSSLKIESELHIESENVKIEYEKDSIITFLKKYFINETIYFTVTREGTLLSVDNESKTISLASNEIPQLSKFIRLSGRFNLKLSNKLIPINYRFPALSFKSGSCAITNFYYFSLANKEIDFVKDSIELKSKIRLTKSSNYCPITISFKFDRDEIKKYIYSYLNVSSINEIKKASNTTSKHGSNFLEADPMLATRMSLKGLEIERNENLYRFIKKVNRDVSYLWDLTNLATLSLTEYKIHDTALAFEVYSPKTKKFMGVKPK